MLQKTIRDIKIRNAYSDKDDLVFVYRDGKQRRKLIVKNYPWYFLVKTIDYKQHFIFRQLEDDGIIRTELGSEFTKIFASKNDGKKISHANNAIDILSKEGIKLYEADLNTVKRYMVDNEVNVSSDYNVLYFDIETDDTDRIIRIGQTRILSFAACDREGNTYFFDDEDEEELLNNIFKTFNKYDVITGWNINGFDLPYIRGYTEFITNPDGSEGRIWHPGRMEIYNMKFDWYRMPNIDMMSRAQKMFKEGAALKSYSLDNVSNYFLGKRKIKFEGRVIDLYNNNRELLKEYNIRDVTLLRELDEKTGMIDLVGKECEIGKTLFLNFKGEYVSEILDMMIMREAHKSNIYVPSKIKRNERSYVGALVLEPTAGVHDMVYVFDYSSLYPSIILSSNIGFDTLAQAGENDVITNPGTRVKFTKSKQSIIAKVVEQLVNERQIYKKKRLDLVEKQLLNTEEYKTARAGEVIVKELSNSVYGLMGDQRHRYYSRETAESITKTGHFLLEFARDYFRYLGYEVIYGDTDSVFVKTGRVIDVDTILENYHKQLEDVLKKEFNIEKSYIKLKYEKLFQRMILVEKKYYCGRIINIEGKEVNTISKVGIDSVKKGVPPISAKLQDELIEIILNGANIEEVEKFIADARETIEKTNFKFDDIRIMTKVGKEISEYSEKSQNQPHVLLAKKIIARDGYLTSSEIEYVVLDGEKETSDITRLALRDEYNGDFDRKWYWNERVYNPLKRILTASFKNYDWNKFTIKKERKQKIHPGQKALF